MSARLVKLIVVIGLISCSTGDDIVKRLKDRYNNAVDKCIDSHRKETPAYECSGIMIRGVNNNLPFAWDMKDLNKQKDAFSLGYLRSDQVFSSILGYDSGFIVYPHMKTPRKKNTYKVFCSFPVNAYTDGREGRHGCGKFKGFPKSGHCDQQNIKSFKDWKSHFNINAKDPLTRQCAFDMTIKSAAKDFAISLKAHRYIQSHSTDYAFIHNELRMHAWSVKRAKNIPIEAFFYLIDSTQGRLLAEKHQDEFYVKSGGENVPIVAIQLPTAQKTFEVLYYNRTPRKHK